MSSREIMMKPTVAVLGTFRFPPERMKEVMPHLKALVEATRKKDGCVAYDVGEDPFDAGLVRFSELWPDQESLTRHLKAPHIVPWLAAAARCGLLKREFFAYDVSGERAM
jgi:quinol monooxygenase YgiN